MTTLKNQPSSATETSAQITSLPEGLYLITNKVARTTVDLPDSAGGTQCHGYSQPMGWEFYNQVWMVQRSGTSGEIFTLQSFEHLTLLEVSEGKVDNGAIVVGRARSEAADSRRNQEWVIEDQMNYFYRIRCARTGTFLEILNGSSNDGTGITCSMEFETGDYQLWEMNRVSRTGAEIKALIESWKPDLLCRSHEDYTEYFVLPSQVRRQIWNATDLLRQPVRKHLFGCDDFVIKSRDAIKTGAKDHFSTDREGYCVLFGLIFGKAERGPEAYNWYLSSDMCSLVFFDAQTGREYCTAALDEFGFEPTFATF